MGSLVNEKHDDDGEKAEGRRSVQEKLETLAPGFGRRIETAAGFFSSVERAATAMGLGHNQLRRVFKEIAVPSFPAIALLAKKTGYRLEWLAFDEKPEKSSVDERLFHQPPEGVVERFVWVPEYDARAAAGHGAMNHETEIRSVFPVPLSMIEGMGVMPERLRLAEAKGESMQPDIRDGDRLIIVIGEDSLRDGAIYVLNFGDDTLVKQIQIEPDGGLTLISKNPLFAPRKIGRDERQSLSIGGRVLGAIKKFV